WKTIVTFDRPRNANERNGERPRPVLAHDQETLRAAAARHTVVQADRIADQTAAKVLLHGERRGEHRHRMTERVGALSDADATEILAGGAILMHVIRGDRREH